MDKATAFPAITTELHAAFGFQELTQDRFYYCMSFDDCDYGKKTSFINITV